jgi:hypothetical protein
VRSRSIFYAFLMHLSVAVVAHTYGASMLDIMFLAIGFAFLGGAMLYAVACERL